MQNCNSIQIVPTGTIVSIIPVGEERVYERFGSNTWDAAGAPDQVPRMNVGIWNGDPLIPPAWVKTTLNVRGWNHKGKLYISPTNFLVMGNPAAGANQNLSAIGNISRQFGTAPLEVITDIVNLAVTGAPGSFVDVRPPVGEEWVITDIGSELWTAPVAPQTVPEVLVQLTDGVSFVTLMNSTNVRGWLYAMSLYISNDVWIRITNPNIATNSVCWSGTRLQTYPSGLPNVMSQVATVLANGTLDAQPANVDEEWLVTAFGALTWVGAAPAALPNMAVDLINATPLASRLARSTDFAHQLSPPDLSVSRANFARFTETSVAGNAIGFSAIRTSLLG